MMRVLSAKGLSLAALGVVVGMILPFRAAADDPYDPYALGTAVPATWGTRNAAPPDATSVSRDSPVTRARELLRRARFLDDAAAVDEKAATELAARLPALRASAKAARERAERSTAEERELLGARAEDLDADVVISEAEVTFKKKTAVDNRRVAHELRLRAMRMAREAVDAPATEETTAFGCDPPFRFTADGRKIYRVECLK
jgi:hypothetical protein